MNSTPDPLPTTQNSVLPPYPTRRLSQILCFVGGGCGPVTIMSVKLYLLQVVLVCTKALGRTVQYVLVLRSMEDWLSTYHHYFIFAIQNRFPAAGNADPRT